MGSGVPSDGTPGRFHVAIPVATGRSRDYSPGHEQPRRAEACGDGAGLLCPGRLLRRRLRHGRADDGDLLPAVVLGQEAPAPQRGVLRHREGRALRRLPAVPALPSARSRRQASRVGGEPARGGGGRSRPPAQGARAARARRQPRACAPLFPEDLRYELRRLLPRPAPRARTPEPARGRGPLGRRARRRLRLGERLPRGLRQALRQAARRGPRERGRDGRLAAHAASAR